MNGKSVRLKRIVPPDGRSLVVAADHGFLMGPSKGTWDLERTLERVVSAGPDALLISKGRARSLGRLFAGPGRPALIIRADWFSAPRIFGDHLPVYTMEKFNVVTAEEAFSLGADAVLAYYLTGLTPAFDRLCLAQVCELLAGCESLGLPLIVEPLVGDITLGPDGRNELLLKAASTCESLGVSALKVPFVDEGGLSEMTSSVEIPVWVLGGEKVEESAALELARVFMDRGARGIVFGRNVIQAEDPGEVCSRLRSIIHVAD